MQIIRGILKRVLNTRKIKLFVIAEGRVVFSDSVRMEKNAPIVAYFTALAKHADRGGSTLCRVGATNSSFYISNASEIFNHEFRPLEINIDVSKKADMVEINIKCDKRLILHDSKIELKKGRYKEHHNHDDTGKNASA